LPLFFREPLVKNQFCQLTRDCCNSRVTKSKSSSKKVRMLRPVAVIFSLISAASAFAITPLDTASQLIISVRDQKLMLLQNGGKVATYPVSTSMFGLGDVWGRMTTPLGYLAVEKKIGDNVPTGAVFHNRRLTGEILQPNAPGRDPVTTRIIWLRGLEAQNAHAFQRCIYIHGTPQEKTIGRPASYGCIRMKSSDIAALYDRVPVGAVVQIIPDRLPKVAKAPRVQPSNAVVAATAPPQNQTQNLAQPENQTQNQDQTEATPAAGALTVDQMRMAGALAAERQKAKLALGKRL
jgi:lipoprotein-anchoring transpeptidase ErfK/SrfK